MNKKVCVLGLGYIGLPTAALLSKNGFDTLGVDIKKNAIESINQGKIHIVEPGLEEIVKKQVERKKLKASLLPESSDIFIIAVPTPFDNDKKANLKFVYQAIDSISSFLKQGNLIIIESTIPVGTTESVKNKLSIDRPDLFLNNGKEQVYIAHCPERVLPGNIMHELVHNDRIIGGIDKESTEKAESFYKSIVKGSVIKTDSKTAELTKLIENSFRDTNIAFANEVSMMCKSLGINTWELISLANRHPRVNILSPGPGVGGHCLAVDPWFVVSSSPEYSKIIKLSREVNEEKTKWVVQNVLNAIQEKNDKNIKIGCFGLAYKQNSDDLRESPSMKIYYEIEKAGIDIIACEPNIANIEGIKMNSMENLIKESDLLLFLVPHNEFKNISKERLKNKIIIDVCGVIENE